MAVVNKNINYYKVLNVTWDSNNIEIKKSYRDLSKVYHPDKNNGDDTEFSKIVEAYKILTNESLRSEYDENSQFGKSYNESNELYNFEFSNSNVQSEKYENDLINFKKKEMVDILLKVKGFREIISYERFVSCKPCDGTGMNFDDHLFVFECDLCDGSGEWKDNMCPSCKGKGESSLKKCDSCNGEKIVEKSETIKLNKEKFLDGKCKIEFKGNTSKLEIGKVGNLYIMITDSDD